MPAISPLNKCCKYLLAYYTYLFNCLSWAKVHYLLLLSTLPTQYASSYRPFMRKILLRDKHYNDGQFINDQFHVSIKPYLFRAIVPTMKKLVS